MMDMDILFPPCALLATIMMFLSLLLFLLRDLGSALVVPLIC